MNGRYIIAFAHHPV